MYVPYTQPMIPQLNLEKADIRGAAIAEGDILVISIRK
jgi:hypothetical protein